jgi:rubrerythrin
MALTGGGSSETAQFAKGDVGILNYALTLEYLETAFYADVVKSGLFVGADLATIRKFGEEEAEHVAKCWPRRWRSTASRAGTPPRSTPCWACRSHRRGVRQARDRQGRPQVRRTIHRQLIRRESEKEKAMSHQELAHPELVAVHVDDDSGDISRSEVILKGALAAGAEYLESSLYDEAKTRAKASGELKSLIGLLAEDEKQHVEALTATIKQLNGEPVAEPKFDFSYSNTAGFLKLAQTFEDTGVSAYNGPAPMIKSKEVLGAAGSIVQVEARHAAAIRLQNKEEPAPEAFDPSLDEAQVLKAVEPFIA